MPNWDHLKILNKGVRAWNKWRRNNPKIQPDLSGANLMGLDLPGINLSGANLNQTDFFCTDLQRANLSRTDLSKVKLMEAILTKANLKGSGCHEVEFVGTKLEGADLSKTDLYGAEFFTASLAGMNLKRAFLDYATFKYSDLEGVNFEKAQVNLTSFLQLDLSKVKGLDSIIHAGPSTIDVDTLYISRGRIPEKFLREAGVPESLIDYLPSLVEATQPVQWHSCFISYSTKNQEFAERLHSRMRQAGLRVWFAPEDMKGGRYSDEQIDQAIQVHDRLLVVLSEDSIQSKWVEREIRKARKVERSEKRRKLFPITLTDYATLKKWECLDSDTGEDLAEEVRKYHNPDFSNWKNHDAFEKAFARLEKDLRTSIGK